MRKNLIFLSVITAFLGIASCQKDAEDITPPAKSSPAKLTSSYGRIATWWGWYMPCLGLPTNCVILPPIVIKPKMIEDLYDAERLGASAVATTFSETEFDPICDLMDPEQVADLQSGNFSILITNDDSTGIVFLAGTGTVTDSSFSYAIQISKQ